MSFTEDFNELIEKVEKAYPADEGCYHHVRLQGRRPILVLHYGGQRIEHPVHDDIYMIPSELEKKIVPCECQGLS